MIIIKDENTGFSYEVSTKTTLQQTLHDRSEELRKIMDDEYSSLQRRDMAYNELAAYREELHNLNELLKVPFDVLVVVQKEE